MVLQIKTRFNNQGAVPALNVLYSRIVLANEGMMTLKIIEVILLFVEGAMVQ